MELTPLRAVGLLAALLFAVVSIWAYRRRRIGNGDLILRFGFFVLPLLVVSLEPAIFGWFLDQFSFKEGGGGRILGAAIVAVGVLYALGYVLASRQERTRRDLTRLIENLALNEFRATADVDEFAGGSQWSSPPTTRQGTSSRSSAVLPAEVSGSAFTRSSWTTARPTTRWSAPGRGCSRGPSPVQPRPGSRARTGYRLALATGARLVVTMDADGQHEPASFPASFSRSWTTRSTW